VSTEGLRVVQWATGNIGTRSLRAVVEHPVLDLAGLYVHSADKAGRDAGSLCGLADTGIVATNDIEQILALGADCVLYMPAACNHDEVVRLLASGANVVTTRGEFHRPASIEPGLRKRVEEACERGGTSIHSTGSSPGFITEALPVVLTSLQRRLDRLTIDEFANLSRRDSPGLLFDVMGYGRPPTAFDDRRAAHLRDAFGPSLMLLAESISMPLDEVRASGELATTPSRLEIAAGTLEAGTVAGQRITVSGMRQGHELMRFRAHWYCTPELEPAWPLQSTGWHVSVEGDTPLEVSLEFPTRLEELGSVTPGYTAHRAVNAVPVVCAAAPGIRTSVELPQIIPILA
jgi:4-hydroxy-tetrahydrodipicolinate reductase